MSAVAYNKVGSGMLSRAVKKAYAPRTLRRQARTILAFFLVTAMTVGTIALTPSKAYAAVPEIRTPLPQGKAVTSTAVVFEPSTVVWDSKRSSDLGATWTADAALTSNVDWDFIGDGKMVRHVNTATTSTALVYTAGTGVQESYTIPQYPRALNGTYASYGTTLTTLSTGATTMVPLPNGPATTFWDQDLTSSDKILWHGNAADNAFDLFAVTSITSGTTSDWVQIAGYRGYEVTSTDLLYLLSDTFSVKLCRRPLTSLAAAPLCLTVASGDYTTDYNLNLSSLGALTLVQIQNLTGTVDKAYIASASLTSVATVAVPTGGRVQGGTVAVTV